MAAGFGSRFGGLKQLHSFTTNNYSILDFSIYDAIQAGFNNIIFIVRQDILNQFKTKYSYVLPKKVSVDFVIQDVNTFSKNVNRQKPWGTGHALLMLKGLVKDKFVIINADDFYGKEAFQLMHNNLFDKENEDSFLIGYQLDKTLSKNGSVSRGECFFNFEDKLTQIVERNKIEYRNNSISYIEENSLKEINSNTIVSMNFWGFTSKILDIADEQFNLFLNTYKNDDSEFYITKVVEAAISKNEVLKSLKTNSQWFGVTYKQDAILVSKRIENLIEKGCYPKVLW